MTVTRPAVGRVLAPACQSIYNVDSFTAWPGCGMDVSINKWGNSAAVRLPASVLRQAGLSLGDRVQVIANPDHTLTLKPVTRRKDAAALLAAMTQDNMPDVSDFETSPVGSEVW